MMEENQKKKEVKLSTVIIVSAIILAIILVIMAVNILGGSNKEPMQPSVKNNVANNNVANNNIANSNLENTNEPAQVVANASEFPIDFMKLENQKKNMVYSPLSIKYALNMLNEGASGNTKKQIDNLISEMSLTKYKNQDKVLSLANAIYIQNNYKSYMKETYQNTLIQKYNAEVNYDDFKTANNINKWIENKTLGIIKNMLEDDQVKDNRLILINALAIDMEWRTQFAQENTYGDEFNLENGSKMVATMMQKESKQDDVSYCKDDNITAISMDLKKYDDTQLEFIAIMPNQDLSEYIKTVTMNDINQVIKKLTPASQKRSGIEIKIPKFSFDYSLKLKQDLISLGITDAFKLELADFTNMSYAGDLFVNDALHKANIEFSEKGIKAAAVTVFTMTDNAMIREEEPEKIKFDKPFMYIIRDKETGEIWFVGTLYEPNSWENDKADYQS